MPPIGPYLQTTCFAFASKIICCRPRLINSERTRELGPEGPKLAGASSYSNACGQWLAKLDLIFNTHRHSVRTDISWSNMPLIMFMGADILFVYFLFRCQSSTSLASYWDRYSYRTFPVLSLSLIVVPPSEWVGQLMCITIAAWTFPPTTHQIVGLGRSVYISAIVFS